MTPERFWLAMALFHSAVIAALWRMGAEWAGRGALPAADGALAPRPRPDATPAGGLELRLFACCHGNPQSQPSGPVTRWLDLRTTHGPGPLRGSAPPWRRLGFLASESHTAGPRLDDWWLHLRVVGRLCRRLPRGTAHASGSPAFCRLGGRRHRNQSDPHPPHDGHSDAD